MYYLNWKRSHFFEVISCRQSTKMNNYVPSRALILQILDNLLLLLLISGLNTWHCSYVFMLLFARSDVIHVMYTICNQTPGFITQQRLKINNSGREKSVCYWCIHLNYTIITKVDNKWFRLFNDAHCTMDFETAPKFAVPAQPAGTFENILKLHFSHINQCANYPEKNRLSTMLKLDHDGEEFVFVRCCRYRKRSQKFNIFAQATT